MKNTIGSIALAAVVGLGFTACGGGKAPLPEPKKDFGKCMKQGYEAPKWVCKPFLRGGLVGLGVAEKSAGGMSMQMDEASAEARKDLAQQIGIKVKAMFKKFNQVSGVGEGAAVDRVASSVQKQITNQNLSGSRPIDTYENELGTLWVLMTLDPAAAATVAKEQIKTSLRNEKALWQQFQAQKADQSLDKEIEKDMAAAKAQ